MKVSVEAGTSPTSTAPRKIWYVSKPRLSEAGCQFSCAPPAGMATPSSASGAVGAMVSPMVTVAPEAETEST